MTESESVVTLEVADAIATVKLNRPSARNALSREVRRLLPKLMLEADHNSEVAAIVLTGADPAFCAGLDLKELGESPDVLADAGATGPEPDPKAALGDPARPTGPFPAMTKPVIGAINGVAITGGLELALACDFLVASDQARFADTHARVGIQPGWGLTVLLPQAVGLRRAREMSATGNFIDAPTALAWGLVNHVVAHADVVEAAQTLGRDIASNDSRAVQTIFATYDEGSMLSAGEAWAVESRTAAAWNGGGFDNAEVERRRQSVIERGRSQF